ncbi:MAG TPA: thiolase family protein [Desulfuromonadales bacterium]|nr:thiolase family protein [Desulfuromonadales bacterium]
MNDVYVVEALRTPFGSFGGMLSDQDAHKLGADVIKGLLEKSGLSPEAITEVIIGLVLTGGCGQAPARQAMVAAGLPDSTHAMTIDKVCGSGLKAMMLASDSLRLGESEVVIAGGMENMSMAPYLLKKGRTGYRMGHAALLDMLIYDALQDPFTGRHMGEISEDAVTRSGLTRDDQDEYAARSYTLAQKAVTEDIFADEIVPITITKKGKKGGVTIHPKDEEPFNGDISKLGDLRPAFRKDGTITAGNASTINDGASLALLTGKAGLKKYNLTPKARFVSYATSSLHPDYFAEAAAVASEKVCAKAGLTLADIDLFEINEAFASVVLQAIQVLNIPLEKVNVNGGACALGHPLAASGARLIATLTRELHRRKLRYGLASICIGGGEAVAVIIERV